MKLLLNKKILVSVLLLCLFVCCTSTKKAEDKKASKSHVKKTVAKVLVEQVKQEIFYSELISNGDIIAKEKAQIHFVVNEQLKTVKVKEGQQIKAGAVLATLEDFTFRKRKKDAHNSFNKALIDLDDLLLGYGFSLADTVSVPSNVLKMCKIRSGYNTALSALEEAKHNLNNTIISSPISGVVSNLMAKKNNHSSQYKYCCQVIDNRIMEVEFYVLEGELNSVGNKQKVKVFPFALTDVSKTGKVTAINPTIENGLVKVTAEISNKERVLMDGMNVKVLLKKAVPHRIFIPKSAVLYRQNRKVVFVHRDGLAHWVYVETGEENSTHICITDKSLKVGEEVIVSNNLNLAHESPIEVVTN